jgi:formiminotetrahydrofolate cyclodeaminase
MDLQKSLQNYLDELSSNAPTPGGGNVAALCGVLAASLGQMVCNLSIGKKKYQEFEEEAKDIAGKLKELQDHFLILAKKDNDAFDKVMDAFKLPKETDIQKSYRINEINKATMEAAIVPSEVIIKCKQLLPYLEIISKKGNQNSLSDAGVAISLTVTAAEGAFLNVAINCASLSNQITANEFLNKSEIIYTEIKEYSGSLIKKIINSMRQH